MTRAALFRLLASIAIVATAGIVAWDSSPRLGLDLSGGTQFVLETKDSETRKADKAATDRTLEVLRGRVDALGVAEPTLVRSGDNRIIVELPGVQDPTEAADTIGKTAQLAFHPVVSQGKGEETTDETGQPIKLGKAAVIGDEISGGTAQLAAIPQRKQEEIAYNAADTLASIGHSQGHPASGNLAVATSSAQGDSNPLGRAYSSAAGAEVAVIAIPLKAEDTMLGAAGYASALMDGREQPAYASALDANAAGATATVAPSAGSVEASELWADAAVAPDTRPRSTIAVIARSRPRARGRGVGASGTSRARGSARVGRGTGTR